MAKKKDDNSLSYLQMPLPSGRKYQRSVKWSWSGLNKRQMYDSGALTEAKNISASEAPYLVTAKGKKAFITGLKSPLGAVFTGTHWLLVHTEPEPFDGGSGDYKYDVAKEVTIALDYYTEKGDAEERIRGLIAPHNVSSDTDTEVQRSFVIFKSNVSSINSKAIRKVLIFPDCVEIPPKVKEVGSFPTQIEYDSETLYIRDLVFTDEYKGGSTVYPYTQTLNGVKRFRTRWIANCPQIKYAVTHLSRLFGVSTDRVFASGFGNYKDWVYDTANKQSEANAWWSATQASNGTDGDFTAIAQYMGHIILFRRNYMQEIHNTKNPFRVGDIYPEGTIDARSVCTAGGSLFFVSDKDVFVYTGARPRSIGYNLDLGTIKKAVAGSDGRNYYLYCEDTKHGGAIYVYDTLVGQWTELDIEDDTEVVFFANANEELYMMCQSINEDSDGLKSATFYRMGVGECSNWHFETDTVTNGTVDIKHIKKIQMLADVDADAQLRLYILYDGEQFSDASHKIYDSSNRTGRITVRVKPRLTAYEGFRIRAEGKGRVKIYGMELFVEDGGELYV